VRTVDAGPFDAAFLASLAGLRLRRARARAADRAGSATAGGRGGRTGFAGHRPYAPGDELRAIDWHATARLGRTFVREREREAAARWTVALDGSASMGAFGKWDVARRLAAAAACLGAAGDGAVDAWLLRDGGARRLAAGSGERGLLAVMAALRTATPGGAAGLARALGAVPRPVTGARLVLVSDLLEEGPWPDALAARAARGEEVAVVEVLAPGERRPAARGVLVLRDPEDPSGPPLRVEVGEREAEAFAAEARRRVADHAAAARRLGGIHLLARTEVAAAETMRALAGPGARAGRGR
jgi:uncharacterized protein (DUF58 family)